MWKPGDLLTHRHNPELGIGRVAAVDGRILTVEFPLREVTLKLATGEPALAPLKTAPPPGVWTAEPERRLVDRLATGDLDSLEEFSTRLDALHLAGRREAQGLGSFLGGRIRLFPHQLHVAERACQSDPVRWLLADEVGLGKTVEACMILNRLVHSRRADRCLIVAPETLTVQWLGELWRKHHQVLVLLDEKRLDDVASDFGAGFNPFDVHRRAVVSLELLTSRPKLTEQAVAAGIDLLVVDEAHRLRRPPGHPGEPEWRAVEPIAALGRHVLLLSAIPFEDDVHGFFRLLQLLRPDEIGDFASFEARLESGEPLPPCTSSTRREDIGGLPPRVALPVEPSAEAWRHRLALEDALRAVPATDALAARRKSDRLRRGLASGAALLPVLDRADEGLRALAAEADANDPRVDWLVAEAPAWKSAGEKTLVFVAHRETLEMLRTALTHRAQVASGVFHEALSPARRDIEVAQFRQAEGPSLLVSTECGGEGRNFEFCHRLVLFDMPWSPAAVEQRIGRLDRIGRRLPVAIVFFRPPAGIGADAIHLFETIGLFREPLAGLEPELAPLEAALERAALQPGGRLTVDAAAALIRDAEAARSRVRAAAYRELHRDRYQGALAESILARVPADLDGLNEDVIVSACERLGFHVEPHVGRRRFSIELGNEAVVDSLSGVPGGSSYLGTFDRGEAVEDEMLDFFATGHPLVEGVLAHLEDAASGRVAVLHIQVGSERGFGLLAIYKDGPTFDAIVVGEDGRDRPGWAKAVTTRPLRTRRVPRERVQDPRWPATVRRLAAFLDPARRPVAVAAIVVG